MAHLDARQTGDQEAVGRQNSFVEIEYEIFSTVIFLPLIQEGQLSVSCERMCTNRLEN